MVAVPETGPVTPPGASAPAGGGTVPVALRLVAVAVSPMELLRPGSDLVRLMEDAGYVDLLLACEDEPVAAPSPVCLLGGGELAVVASGGYDYPDDYPDDYDDQSEVDEVRAAVERLDIEELHVHRLGLRPPLGGAAEADLVAALSELVGFDPEPGVHCLAPTAQPGDPGRAVVDRAVRRIAQVYGLPVMRYRCLELSVVDDD